MKCARVFWLLMAVFAAQPAHSASLLTNGDFETGDITGWVFTPGLSADPNQVFEVVQFPPEPDPEGSLAFRINPGENFDDDLVAADDSFSGGRLSQLVSLTAGVDYEISGEIWMLDLEQLPETFLTLGGRISVFLGDVLIAELGESFVGALLVHGGLYRIEFLELFTPDMTGDFEFAVDFKRRFPNSPPTTVQYADNLSVAVAPEPVAVKMLLVFLGLAGLNMVTRGAVNASQTGARSRDRTPRSQSHLSPRRQIRSCCWPANESCG